MAKRLAYTEQDASINHAQRPPPLHTASDAMSVIVLFGEQQAKFTHFC